MEAVADTSSVAVCAAAAAAAAAASVNGSIESGADKLSDSTAVAATSSRALAAVTSDESDVGGELESDDGRRAVAVSRPEDVIGLSASGDKTDGSWRGTGAVLTARGGE